MILHSSCNAASKTLLLAAAAAAFLFSAGNAVASDEVLLALNKPARPAIEVIASGLKEDATAQAKANGAMEYTDFDAFSTVGDPLYREGSREFLEQAVKADPVLSAPAADKKAMRDAPAEKKPAAVKAVPVKQSPAVKKAKAVKPLKADPVKAKDSL